jgi:transposase-like protein
MSKNGKRYDKDFKQMINELFNSTDSTLADLEAEYGVTSATIPR